MAEFEQHGEYTGKLIRTCPLSTTIAMLPICDWATMVDFRSQSGENGSPNSASLSPCGKKGGFIHIGVGKTKVTSRLDTKPLKSHIFPFVYNCHFFKIYKTKIL